MRRHFTFWYMNYFLTITSQVWTGTNSDIPYSHQWRSVTYRRRRSRRRRMKLLLKERNGLFWPHWQMMTTIVLWQPDSRFLLTVSASELLPFLLIWPWRSKKLKNFIMDVKNLWKQRKGIFRGWKCNLEVMKCVPSCLIGQMTLSPPTGWNAHYW